MTVIHPSRRTVAVTPDDSGLPGTPIGLLLGLTYSPDHDDATEFDRLWVGVTGDISIRDKRGNAILFGQVPVGELNVFGRRVLSTNTTAQEIVAIRD